MSGQDFVGTASVDVLASASWMASVEEASGM